MNTLRFKQLFFISSLAGILVAMGSRSAQAETFQAMPQANQTPDTAGIRSDAPLNAQPDAANSLTVQEEPLHSEPTPVINAEAVPPLDSAEVSADSLQGETQRGTETAQMITPQDDQSGINTEINANIDAQGSNSIITAQEVDPGRATRSGSSYIGIGGNIGFGGDSGLGTGNFAILSKVGITENISLRPAALVGDGVTFLFPATVDFPIAVSTTVDDERIGLAPFIGGGIAIGADDDSEIQPLVTVGVDVPITNEFTANASANVSFPDDVEVGVILGIGYNFR
ncbi:hypothetical protein [Leptolyngbya sp. FACHB-711]|uniref:hypothetical protein n=1 Tax=unclassified Leptolyngbya TaxID=2650499 RepID=UPI001683D4CE|nr:hypothetical protein [Leptolyngbya sp. FACHB-711]MBD1851348.1 hypothetical protein [Cyanobacteria bacterium FACHB-502]MBD2023668.1 hypothetical protein [Leptolyngbya sp. FACHB-711]